MVNSWKQRRFRTSSRGRNYNHGRRNFFYKLSVTNWIVLVNVLLFFIISIIAFSNPKFFDYISLTPKNLIEKFHYWTLLTSMFMHGGLGHLFVNMVSMMFIGNFIEKLIGRKRFFWFYMISGIFAGLLFSFMSLIIGDSFLFGTGYTLSGVGASGALFGIAGLLMILTPDLPLYVMFIPIPIKAKHAIPGMLIVLALLSAFAQWPVGNMAHFGGLLAGIIYGIFLANKYQRKTKAIRIHFK